MIRFLGLYGVLTVVLLVQDFDHVVLAERDLRTVRALVAGEALVQHQATSCREKKLESTSIHVHILCLLQSSLRYPKMS